MAQEPRQGGSAEFYAFVLRPPRMSDRSEGVHDEPPRLSKKERIVLEMLVGRGALYGLELVEASDGQLGRGTVYVTLSRMTDKGYLESYEEDTPAGYRGPKRRRYRITGVGARALQASDLALAAWRGRVAT